MGWKLGVEKSNNSQSVSTELTKENPKSNQQVQFVAVSPKYTLNDILVSPKVFTDLNTIIQAKSCWDLIFNQWGLSYVMKEKQNLMINLYGQPGTGKTMSAHAIAHELNKKIICVNYADIESKYVGETSKNLTELFNYAQQNDYIIFFDEADALLSKRVTNMSNATDVSVNQTRSVLLTLLNDYTGMVIFATNFITNYDSAFMRRIQYHVEFELPDIEVRELLWKKYIPKQMPTNVNVSRLSNDFANISGSDISNAVLKASLYAASNKYDLVEHSFFEDAIKNIIKAKNSNDCKYMTTTTKNVTEEYALSQINKN